MTATLQGMNHFTILAKDLDETRRFYTDILGFRDGWRPPLEVQGIWFYVGEQPILHVVQRDPLPDRRAGVLDHMAFSATGLSRTVRELNERGIEHETGQQIGSRIWQVFFHDPNGAKIELDFSPEEILDEDLAS